METKTTFINALVVLTEVSSGCHMGMAWETPIARFTLDGKELTWQSDSDLLRSIWSHNNVGNMYWLEARVKANGRIHRVYSLKLAEVK